MVKRQLKSLSATASSNDVLDIDSKLMSIAHELITPIITTLINMSLTIGVVLDDWKLSRVTPIFKGKGDANDENNYRPISVIGHVSKILEKNVQIQLIKYLIDHDLISIDQSAYLKKHSTITSLHKVIEDWIDNVSDKLLTGICLLDISKCFDTIDHEILLNKLRQYGINNVQQKWFCSYLSNRTQVVFCNNSLSEKRNILLGVPQGSVLGPILFTIFSNDLPNHTHIGSCNMYADDTLIYATGKSLTEVQSRLQQCIDDASSWYLSNNLVLNAKKSNSLLISNPKRDMPYNVLNISIGSDRIEHVNDTKYLGLDIDHNLSWEKHIRNLCKRLRAKIGELKFMKKTANKDMLLYFYNVYIQPLIDYGITIWSNAQAQLIAMVQRLQNICARLILDNFNYNVRGLDLVRSLQWMNIKERSHYFTLLLIFKCLHGIAPTYLENQICFKKDMDIRSSGRVSNSDVFIPQFVSSTKE